MKTKKNGNLRIQNAISNETLAAPIYEGNPNQLYSQGHIENNPMTVSSKLSEPLGYDPNVLYPLRNVPSNVNANTSGNAPSTSNIFFSTTVIMEMLLLLLKTEMLRTKIHYLNFGLIFVNLQMNLKN